MFMAIQLIIEMDISDTFHQEIIEEIIKVHPRFLGSNIKNHLISAINTRYEDNCSKHGYIRKGSIELLSIGAMQGEMHTLRGYVNISVRFMAMTCNPAEKSVIKAVVRSINKFGVMTICEMDGREIIHIVVPRNILSVKSLVSIDSLAIGDVVLVEIIKRKFEVGESVMYGIGRIVGDSNIDIEGSDNDTDVVGGIAATDIMSDDEIILETDDEDDDEIEVEDDEDKKEIDEEDDQDDDDEEFIIEDEEDEEDEEEATDI